VTERFRLTSRNVHRLFLTCVVLSAKHTEDRVSSNKWFARVGGISTAELNKLERAAFKLLGYHLRVQAEEYHTYMDALVALSEDQAKLATVPDLEEELTPPSKEEVRRADKKKAAMHADFCCQGILKIATMFLGILEPVWDDLSQAEEGWAETCARTW